MCSLMNNNSTSIKLKKTNKKKKISSIYQNFKHVLCCYKCILYAILAHIQKMCTEKITKLNIWKQNFHLFRYIYNIYICITG